LLGRNCQKSRDKTYLSRVDIWTDQRTN
jgi:hypothetical protein